MSEECEYECPGEAHELDNTFNPSTQGPYGPGFHDCDVCFGEGVVSKEVHDWEIDRRRRWEIHLAEMKEAQKSFDAIMNMPKSKIDFLK